METNEGVKPEYDPNILGQTEKENMDYAVENIEKMLIEAPAPVSGSESEPVIGHPPVEPQKPEPTFTYTPPLPPGIPDYVVQDNVIITQALEDLQQRMAEHERSPFRHSTDKNIKGAWAKERWDLVDEKVRLEQSHQNIFHLTMQAIKPVMDQHQQAQRQQQADVQSAWDAEMESIVPNFDDSVRQELVSYLRGKNIPDQRIAAYAPKEVAAFYHEMKGGHSVKPVQRIPLRQKAQSMDAEQQRQNRMDNVEKQITRMNLPSGSIEANALRLEASGYTDQFPASPIYQRLQNAPAKRDTSIDGLKNRLRQTGKVEDAAEIFYRTLFGKQ